MNIRKILSAVIVIVIVLAAFFGFTYRNQIAVKLGFKNNYFNFFKDNRVTEVSIQSARDPSFKILVTQSSEIQNIYQMLSSAKVVKEKSTLDPDYTVTISEGTDSQTYDYVVNGNNGNFYRGNEYFHLSKRLDSSIIQNLTFIQQPRDFNVIYYDSILDVLKKVAPELNQGNDTVGINLSGDLLCTKFQLSSDINNFMLKAKNLVPKLQLVNSNNENNFDIVVGVKCYGFNTKVFKTVITVNDQKDNTSKSYYVQGNYDQGWNIEIYNQMPQEWNS
ncbi:MAG: hypothetical protein ACRDD2_03215 [Sarcina sp.]